MPGSKVLLERKHQAAPSRENCGWGLKSVLDYSSVVVVERRRSVRRGASPPFLPISE